MNRCRSAPYRRLAAARCRLLRRRLALACLLGCSLLASVGAAQDRPPAREAAGGRGAARDGVEDRRGADDEMKTKKEKEMKSGPLTVEPQERMRPEQAARVRPERMQRMRERLEEKARRAQDEERPRWFEVPDPPEGVDAPPAPDAVDGEITVQRLQEESR